MRSLYKVIGVAILILTLSGCALGGGTIGTGVAGLSATPSGNLQRSLLRFRARGVVTLDGVRVSGGKLSAFTADGVEVATIGANGAFDLPISKAPGESVIFEIELSDKSYRIEAELSPAGASIVNVNFLISKAGNVRIQRTH